MRSAVQRRKVLSVIYGYARVSTFGQAREGNSLEWQIEQLRREGCEKIFADSFTGTEMNRPEFNKLMSALQSGDRLVVAKLDRFARTAGDGINMIRELLNRGVAVHILNMGLIDNTPTGKLMVTVMLGFAEFERDMIIERTATGKAIARANNPDYKDGRKEKEIDEKVFSELRAKNKKGDIGVSECCKILGISRGTWYNRAKGA